MECGVPFCHDGCPLGNLIPDWNDLVYQGRWREAIDQLHATNDFPEWTGLICPAPCEPACVLSINDDPVTIKQIELAIVERAWEEGWIVPAAARVAHRPDASPSSARAPPGSPPPRTSTAPATRSWSTSATRARAGCSASACPTSSSRSTTSTGASPCSRRRASAFEYGVDVGSSLSAEELLERHDAVVLAIGSRVHRPLDVPGADLQGVRFAMDYLYARNRFVARGEDPADDPELTAAGKHVVVIGGGDTAMDCVGNANREGAASVTVLDTYPAPPGPNARDSRAVARVAAPARDHLRARRGRGAALDADRDAGSPAATAASPPCTAPTSPRRPGRSPCPAPSSSCPPTSCSSPSASRTPSTPAPWSSSRSISTAGAMSERRRMRRRTRRSSPRATRGSANRSIVNAIAEGRRCARVVDRHLAALTPA